MEFFYVVFQVIGKESEQPTGLLLVVGFQLLEWVLAVVLDEQPHFVGDGEGEAAGFLPRLVVAAIEDAAVLEVHHPMRQQPVELGGLGLELLAACEGTWHGKGCLTKRGSKTQVLGLGRTKGHPPGGLGYPSSCTSVWLMGYLFHPHPIYKLHGLGGGKAGVDDFLNVLGGIFFGFELSDEVSKFTVGAFFLFDISILLENAVAGR